MQRPAQLTAKLVCHMRHGPRLSLFLMSRKLATGRQGGSYERTRQYTAGRAYRRPSSSRRRPSVAAVTVHCSLAMDALDRLEPERPHDRVSTVRQRVEDCAGAARRRGKYSDRLSGGSHPSTRHRLSDLRDPLRDPAHVDLRRDLAYRLSRRRHRQQGAHRRPALQLRAVRRLFRPSRLGRPLSAGRAASVAGPVSPRPARVADAARELCTRSTTRESSEQKQETLMQHPVVSREEWLKARVALLAREKAWTRQRDQIRAERLALPWVRVEKEYVFAGPDGKLTLADLFAGRSQL